MEFHYLNESQFCKKKKKSGVITFHSIKIKIKMIFEKKLLLVENIFNYLGERLFCSKVITSKHETKLDLDLALVNQMGFKYLLNK